MCDDKHAYWKTPTDYVITTTLIMCDDKLAYWKTPTDHVITTNHALVLANMEWCHGRKYVDYNSGKLIEV